MSVPGRLAFRPDGASVTFLWSPRGDLVRGLYELPVEGGEPRPLVTIEDVGGGVQEGQLTREEALRRERERLRETGITHYQWAARAPVILLPVGERVLSWREGKLTELARGATEARLSADGEQVVYVREGGLWSMSSRGGDGRPICAAEEEGRSVGVAEYAAQEEMGRSEGFWISPQARQVAFTEVDERHIPIFRIPHLARDIGAEEAHRYPFAGAENARLRLGVAPIGGGELRWLDIGPFEYLCRVDWRGEEELLVQVQPRDQRQLELRSVDLSTGTWKLLRREVSKSWVNLHNDLRTLPGGRLLWSSEESGFRHLGLIQPDGSFSPLTSGEWAVDGVVGVAGELVYFTCGRPSPLERQVWRVSLRGGEPEPVTTLQGLHSAVLSADGRHLIDTHEHLEQAPTVRLLSLQRRRPDRELHHPGPMPPLRPPELWSFTARDGERLYAALYRPSTPAPWPLVVHVYGGPHVQVVAEGWAQTVDLRCQHLAEQGFAVLKVDNRGSARRGLAFESAIYRDMGRREVDDQVDGVRHLIERGLVDPARIGIVGWSYGGYMVLRAMALAPDLFRAGVSGAPVTEWEGYDTHYTERYMSTPQDNPEGYRAASVLTVANQIRGKLLVVHGMIDENVHFRHAARLVDRLVKAGVGHELQALPDERHMPRAEGDRMALEQRIVDWFRTHLNG